MREKSQEGQHHWGNEATSMSAMFSRFTVSNGNPCGGSGWTDGSSGFPECVQDVTLESVCDLTESLCLWECFRHIASDFPLCNFWVHALHLGWYYGTAMKCMILSLPMLHQGAQNTIGKKDTILTQYHTA